MVLQAGGHRQQVERLHVRDHAHGVLQRVDGGHWAERVESLRGGTAPHAQLQVLLWAEGLHDATRRADRQAKRASALTHDQQRPDVSSSDLRMLAGTLGPHRQAVVTPPLTAPDRAVSKGSGDVIELGLVQLLIDALTHVLKDDGYLRRKKTTRQHV
uniref:Uncharacterized protein n=1 Tax=Labrus bergylta TaxID=56723 RepID=A0A3Q3G799_9LABR